MSFFLPDPLDPALRQPITQGALVPLHLSVYALAVLAILPNTFILKLSILPFIVWQGWSCAVGQNFATGLARGLGHQNAERLNFWNPAFVVSAVRFPAWKMSHRGTEGSSEAFVL
jgi:hypothetical protein